MSQDLRYLQNILNNSGIQDREPALFQVISEILLLEINRTGDSDRLVAPPLEFVLDPNLGLYLENMQQSGNAQFPFKVDLSGNIYEKFRTVPLGGWTPYTPVWTSSAGPAPVMGASTLVGAYTFIGSTCLFYLQLTLGAGFAFGGGAQLFSLPALIAVQPSFYAAGRALVAGANYQPVAYNFSTSTIGLFTNGAPNALYNAGVPGVWVNTNFVYVTGFYRIA